MHDALWEQLGYKAIKMRAGLHTVGEDVERVGSVADALGPDVRLMIDCLQMMDRSKALELGQALEQFDLTWIVDPIVATDVEGHAELSRNLCTPVATGEHEYGSHGFQHLIDAEAASILLIDLCRVGGIQEFVDVAENAHDRGLKIVSHCVPEQSLQVMAAIPNCYFVDQLSWSTPLYNETIEFADGHYVIPDRPGFGFSFRPEVVDQLTKVTNVE